MIKELNKLEVRNVDDEKTAKEMTRELEREEGGGCMIDWDEDEEVIQELDDDIADKDLTNDMINELKYNYDSDSDDE